MQRHQNPVCISALQIKERKVAKKGEFSSYEALFFSEMFLILKMYLFMSLILAAKLGIVWDCLLLAVENFPISQLYLAAQLLDSSKVIITVLVMMKTKTMKGLAYMMLIDHAVIIVRADFGDPDFIV